jgi:hypothetical protein
MPIEETPSSGPQTANDSFPKELERAKIKLKSKRPLSRLSAIVPRIQEPTEPKSPDMPADEEIELEQADYLTWIEGEIEGPTPPNPQKRKVLKKIKASTTLTEEARNQLLDDLITAEDEKQLAQLETKLKN